MVTNDVCLAYLVSAPIARHKNAESERGDNTSAINSEDLLEEVDHVRFRFRLAHDCGVALSSETKFVLLVTLTNSLFADPVLL